MPARPYPDRGRAARAVRRRREAYERTLATQLRRRLELDVLHPLRQLGIDLDQFKGPTTAEVLRPYHAYEERMQARTRARTQQLEPVFRRLYLNSRITSLDT